MKVVLVYVGVGVAGFNLNFPAPRPLGCRESSWIGHGIASIGACLKQAGHEVELIDLRQLGSWEHFIQEIKDRPADVYGLSVSPVDGQFADPIAEIIKFIHPECKIFAGGIHPTIFTDCYIRTKIDTVVIGEGEVTVVDLLEKGEWPKVIRGVKPDLAKLPWIDRELFDYQRELACFFAPDQKTPSITMLAGRGCNFGCTYCQPAENAVFGKPFRIRPAQDVVDELVYLKDKYDYKSITFWDDTFTFAKKWVMEFCDLYEKAGIGASIAACSRADIVCRNEEMIERLASVGLDWFVIGFESGSQRILDLIKKGTTVEQNIKSAQIARKYGIKIFGTYMYGLPTETRSEALQTAKMIDTIAPEHPSPFYFLPIEGTDIYNLCHEQNLINCEPGTIERTGMRTRALKNIDYDYLDSLMRGERKAA